MNLYVELSADGVDTIRFSGGATEARSALYVTSDGIEGWYGTPDPKVTLTERGMGDGAHDIPDAAILYAARTVTISYGCVAQTRQEALGLLFQVQQIAHRQVRVRVVDDVHDTYCDGYMSSTVQPEWHERGSWQDVLTIVCPRPERLSTDVRRFQLQPDSTGAGGLTYGTKNLGLVYPLSYGPSAADSRNVCTLLNMGSSRAYPVYTVHGDFPDGVELQFTNGHALSLDLNVGAVPVILDSRSGTATLGGQDVSRRLARRTFPPVEPQASLTVSLQSSGSGYVDCRVHDTWM